MTHLLHAFRSAVVSSAVCLFVMPMSTTTATAAPVLFDQTLVNGLAVVNNNPGDIGNCLGTEGCLGFGSTFPVPLVFAPIAYFLSPAQVAAVTSTPVVGRFTIVASRDIGHKVGAQALDFLSIRGDGGIALGDLFVNTIDTCPAGERGSPGYPDNLNCGPNFHTDVQATDLLTIGQSDIQSFAADGAITFTIDPSGDGAGGTAVGRLKLFSFRLEIEAVSTAVPEPSALGLLCLALVSLAFTRRIRASGTAPHNA
jgi:hypothetical protein